MDIIHLLIYLLIACAALAIGFWAVRAMGITIPQPIMIIIVLVIAIGCLLFLADMLGGGGGSLLHSRC